MGGVSPKIDDIEITENLDEFYRIRKHFIVLTDAGKPVYTRYGDEMTLAPFIATISAIIPKIQSYFWDNNTDARQNTNKLRTIVSDRYKCYLLQKGGLIYICMVSMHERCSIGGYFLDDLVHQPDLQQKPSKHILEEDLRPSALKETNAYVNLQLEYLHLQLISVITQASVRQLK